MRYGIHAIPAFRLFQNREKLEPVCILSLLRSTMQWPITMCIILYLLLLEYNDFVSI